MALTQDQRIEISKKIVSIPSDNASALDSKSKLNEARIKTQNEDDGNRTLCSDKTLLINGYQSELSKLDGSSRSEILEQDFIDSANNKLGNFFFPNQINIPTTSLSDGIWRQFLPYARNKAVGKFYNEAYLSTQKESDIISAIQSYNTTMDGYTGIQRTTGQTCTPGVFPLPDVIANNSTIQSLSSNIITQVQAWKSFLQTTLSVIVTTDSNTTRQSQNNIAINDINNSIIVINSWLAATTFDTNHGQTTCLGFNAYNPFLLQSTKFRTDVFNTLKNEITARLSFITVRSAELNSNLGFVVQNIDNGKITSSSGLYAERFNFINLRLNLMSGTLKKLEGLKMAQKAQDEAVDFNLNALSAYSSVIFASLLLAPSTGNSTLHLKDVSGINSGDTVYIMANDQQEIELNVLSKTGNAIQVDKEVSMKYRTNNLSRVYKIL